MFSLIIPVYKNEANIPPLLEAVQKLRDQIDDDFEVILVVDGSPDRSYLVLKESLPATGLNAQLVALSRNFGSLAAIRAGLERAKGDNMAVMAADLQEPPELVVGMQQALAADECDVVYGERQRRGDPWHTRMASSAFWGAYRRFVAPDIPKGGVDTFGITSAVRDQILGLTERNSSLVGLLFWIGFRRKGLPYDRADREIGTSSWTFTKKWKYMQDSIFSFSDLPISLLLILGFGGLAISIFLGLVVFLSAVFGQIDVPGYAATMLVILFFSTLQLLSLGVLGIYLWRVFENTKGRPLHIVMSSEKFPGNQPAIDPAQATVVSKGGPR
ncbi:glycosyltransferase family 2 protein [Sedimentitalea nanhaiensis]|uniref:Glycosyltransferase involved in cell wall bisynthesis n=1 Tax=Sedimentitalea nanhaiensis TaxID=999627 RepID=A0A1I7DM28_9RHOB|nr:glycosyltransferase family 2 protein [Sedimentitalea nanhaiensis]SFU12686.1 Glycosyltransferase involved in cell wall bisynthesis [Sedimentitalea nanhaiensis]